MATEVMMMCSCLAVAWSFPQTCTCHANRKSEPANNSVWKQHIVLQQTGIMLMHKA